MMYVRTLRFDYWHTEKKGLAKRQGTHYIRVKFVGGLKRLEDTYPSTFFCIRVERESFVVGSIRGSGGSQ